MSSRGLTFACLACAAVGVSALVLCGPVSHDNREWIVAGADDLPAFGTHPQGTMHSQSVPADAIVVRHSHDVASGWGSWTFAKAVVGEASAQGRDVSGTSRTEPETRGLPKPSHPRFSRVTMDLKRGGRFEGTGRPGSSVVLWKKGWAIGRARVGADGRWSVEVDDAFQAGDHRITVSTRENDGPRVIYGQEVRIAIPEDFGRTDNRVTFDISDTADSEARGNEIPSYTGEDEASLELRRRAEELARAASEKFSEITGDGPADAAQDTGVNVDAEGLSARIAEQTGASSGEVEAGENTGARRSAGFDADPPPPERRSLPQTEERQRQEDQTALAPISDWLERARRQYQDVIVPGLSYPPRQTEVPGGVAPSDDQGGALEQDAADASASDRKRDEQRLLDQEAAVQRERRAARSGDAEIESRGDKPLRSDAAERARDANALEERLRARERERQQRERLAREADEREAERRQRIEEQRRELALARERAQAQRLADQRALEIVKRERRAAEARKAAEAEREKLQDRKFERAQELARLDSLRRARALENEVDENDAANLDRVRGVANVPIPSARPQTNGGRSAARDVALPERTSRANRVGRAVERSRKPMGLPERNRWRPVQMDDEIDLRAERGRTDTGRATRVAGARYSVGRSGYGSKRCRERAGLRVRTLPGTYTVSRGDTLWAISRRHYRRGIRYPIIYNANRDRIRDPDLIYPCQRFRLPKR